MGSLLLISLLIGMRHALEADHVAAVASLVHSRQSLSHSLRLGALWGLGHAITLLLFGVIVIAMDNVIPHRLASGLELAVGIMLVLLGGDVLRRLLRDRVHFHSHRHGDDEVHFHAHRHSEEELRRHDPAFHHHQHHQSYSLRALLIGLMHGMAGSAAVILLSLQSGLNTTLNLAYIAIFGVGSMIGMALLSIVISLPLRMSASCLNRVQPVFSRWSAYPRFHSDCG